MTETELKEIEERAKEMLTEKAHQMSAYKARECIQDIPRLIKALREAREHVICKGCGAKLARPNYCCYCRYEPCDTKTE